MDVVALVSGGKDSCYASHLALRQGHRIVALANLFTPVEVDSWMYQSAATDFVGIYAKAFGSPMYRTPLTSSTTPHKDEDFDRPDAPLTQMNFPSLKGVVSGAILSNYQRIRIEDVCSRLGLVSISPLWERDQDALLQEMLDAGMDAVLVKVAALGLDQRLLGKSIRALQPYLRKLAAQYGINVCGEGGEYESFTLDAPFFKYRVEILSSSVVLHDQSAYASVSLLDIKEHRLIWKGEGAEPLEPAIVLVEPSTRLTIPNSLASSPIRPSISTKLPFSLISHGFLFHGLTSAIDSPTSLSFEAEAWATMDSLKDSLSNANLTLKQIFHVNVYMSDISQFPVLNSIYGLLFPRDPPSRATLELKRIAESFGRRIVVEVFGFNPSPTSDSASVASRRVLHVQSISNWAPACIGPYSQANILKFPSKDPALSATTLASLAGQISLDPPTMTMRENLSTADQLQLAYRHQQSVQTAIGFKTAATLAQAVFTSTGDSVSEVDTTARSRLVVKVSALPKGAKAEVQSFLVALGSPFETLFRDMDLFSFESAESGPFMRFTIASKSPVTEAHLSNYIRAALDVVCEELQGGKVLSWKIFYEPSISVLKVKEALRANAVEAVVLLPAEALPSSPSLLIELWCSLN